MKWTTGTLGALLLAAALPAVAADAAWTGYGMIGSKIEVKDFDKSIAFYTKLGMKIGPKHNAAEQELNYGSTGPKLILVHDETGRIKLAGGKASLMMQVADVAETASQLKAAGYPNIGEPRSNKMYSVLMIKDPDGNDIEMLGPPPKEAAAAK
jgi:predicted lactoylglutathione lyase